jgi:outer membrane protein OmpA-like peptidoglycan-associated protein
MLKTSVTAFFILMASILYAQSDTSTVHFDFDKSNLTEKEMEKVKAFFENSKQKNGQIVLYGHTDSKGSDNYNLALSKRRVNSVKQYLLSLGFPIANIINANAYGESQLILKEDDDKDRGEINRRVEIVFAEIASKTEPITTSIDEQIKNTDVKKGSTIVLKNLQFIGGKHVLLSTSLPQLKELLATLQKNENLKIIIEGHICCLPTKDDGMDIDDGTENLSETRAKAIYDYLIKEGIDAERLSYKGFGHTNPIYKYPERTLLEQSANRRVEIRIVSK